MIYLRIRGSRASWSPSATRLIPVLRKGTVQRGVHLAFFEIFPGRVRAENRLCRIPPERAPKILTWITNFLHGDFGASGSLDRPLIDEIGDRLGMALILAGSSGKPEH